ncbi:MAG TPA: efflux RND transporter permease subunit [Woeseiaceae bacterium]|nr:efflux RND transporter permease subunit [Woeseiaceae bacterium]
MLISDISVQRPVFAAVISLILVIVGLMSLRSLTIREYPDIERPVVSVNTNYRGAASDVVERRVTQIIEDQVAGISGIEKISSVSYDERSSISLEFSLDRDVDAAANDVRDRVARVLSNLPEEADPPEIAKQNDASESSMWIDFSSDSRSVMELTDYAERHLVDALSIVNGVAFVRLSGERRKAMRIWIDPQRMAARGLTVTDIEDALRRENVQIPSGRIESSDREFTLRTNTGFVSEDDFRNLVLARGSDNYLIRLGEVADVQLAAESERGYSRTNGAPGMSLGIIPQAKANILQVNSDVRRRIEELRSTIPEDINFSVNIDTSVFISESLKEVAKALGIALLLVLVVIYSFIGTIRATFIPAITIPISIIASFTVMAAMGYSINVITLLGLVLAIGLVVDDAIVVLENIVRRIEMQEPVLLAATNGTREIGFAVIATTLVLVAVFLPVSFMPGNIGRIFTEFGISLAAAVLFSSLVALTLVPMLSSKFFATGLHRGRLTHVIDGFFRRLSSRYSAMLRRVIRHPWLVITGALFVFGCSMLVFAGLQVEYMPREDRGMAITMVTGPDGSSLEYTSEYVREIEKIMMKDVETGEVLRVGTRSGARGAGGDVNTARVFAPMALWHDRERTAQEIVTNWNRQFVNLPGVSAYAFVPGGGGVGMGSRPLQVVLGGTDYDELASWRDLVIEELEKVPGLSNLDSDYKERKPKIDVSIDRDRAADLGVSLSNVGRTLETILGSRVVTTFIDRGEEYRVILQGRDERRQTPSDLDQIYVRSDRMQQLIPLSNLVKLQEVAGPVDLRRFDRLRAITISASLEEGYSLGTALDTVEEIIRNNLPESAQINYDGESRELKRSGSSLYFTFLLALIIVYLVLAAQFESFKHPLIIMTTVPLAVAGAVIGLQIFGSSINIFSQIGAIMLIGLAAKNGILIVEFANQLRDRGREFRDAVVESATTRLRPVLMTSLCTAFGSVPLVLATGAGAESRQSIGAAVFFGVTFSMFLTLIVVPAVYALVARKSHSPQYIAQMIEKLKLSEASLLQPVVPPTGSPEQPR